MRFYTLIAGLLMLATSIVYASELTLAREHINKVLAQKQTILSEWPDSKKAPVFVAVADFDGTLIYGDCTEGLVGSYSGLAKKVILTGLTDFEASETGFNTMWERYEYLSNTNETESVLFLPSVLDPREPEKNTRMHEFVAKTFRDEFRQYIFPTSRYYVETLREHDIETIVISASPQVFVDGLPQVLPILPENVNGVSVNDEMVPTDGILNYREGKLRRLRHIIAQAAKSGTTVIPLIGLGNDWVSDYPFLKAIASGELGAKGISIMINGLRPTNKPTDSPLIEVTQTLKP